LFWARQIVWNRLIEERHKADALKREYLRQHGEKAPFEKVNEYVIGVSSNPGLVGFPFPPSRKCLSNVAHVDLPEAYNRWYAALKERKGNRAKRTKAENWAHRKVGRAAWMYGQPKKKRRENAKSTYLHSQAFKVIEDILYVGGVPGGFKLAHPFHSKDEKLKFYYKSGGIREQAGHFFATFTLEVPQAWLSLSRVANDVTGIDLGISKALVTGNAETKNTAEHKLPRYWEDKHMRRLQKLKTKWSHAMQRRMDGAKKRNVPFRSSGGYREAVAKLGEINLAIVNLRRDQQHKLTTKIVKQSACVVVEDLNVKGMTGKNEKHAPGAKSERKRILDTGFGEIRRQLTYKSPRSQTRLLVADRFFASTQTCSGCGNRLRDADKLSRGDKIYNCPKCGLSLNRDHNAALTLANLGQKHFEALNPEQVFTTDEDGQLVKPKEIQKQAST
jgi:putative transposase